MMRKTIARRLTESKQTVPHFYLTIDVDAEPLSRLREQINADLAATRAAQRRRTEARQDVGQRSAHQGVRRSRSCRVPECNAQFTPEAILVHRRVDISVAVAGRRGPRHAGRARRRQEERRRASRARCASSPARAKAKKLKPEEMTDGTFSISNLGMFGIDAFSAVINPPEGAILAVGQVRESPSSRKARSCPAEARA